MDSDSLQGEKPSNQCNLHPLENKHLRGKQQVTNSFFQSIGQLIVIFFYLHFLFLFGPNGGIIQIV